MNRVESLDARKYGSNKSGWPSYIIKYTALFLFLAFIAFLPFIVNGKSLVYYDLHQGGDGLVIHYNSFVYYGKYLRGIFKSFLDTGQLIIPMWDPNIGFGQDIIQTLWFYAIGDPFAALSFFVPTKYSEIGYCFITLLELYCAGLAFSVYAIHMKRSANATLASSLVYVFSSYPLLISTLHPYFTLPMIFLPLLLIGVERLNQRNYDLFYVAVIALSAFSCFYFFYMLCIFVFLYALYRYFCTNSKSLKGMLAYALKFLLNTFLGIGISAILLLPVLSSLMGSTRVNADVFVPLLYPLNYYLQELARIMVGGGSYYNHEGYTAFGAIALISTVILSRKSKTHRRLAFVAVVLLAFVCIPFIGHVFNGFSYVTNRWIWAFDCFFSYLIATAIDDIGHLDRQDWRLLSVATIIYLILCFIPECNRTVQCGINAVLLVVFVATICFVRHRIVIRKNTFERMITVMVFVAVAINAQLLFAPGFGNYIQYFGEVGGAYSDLVKQSPGHEILSLGEADAPYRFDSVAINEGEVKRNSNMLLGLMGTSYYYSTGSGNFGAVIRNLEINNPMEQTYVNLDARSYLDALFGIKYIVVKNGFEKQLPHGYSTLCKKGKEYSVYSADYCLPLAFSTDKLLSAKQYEDASAAQRQEMLLQGLILDGEQIDEQDYSYHKTSEQKIPFKITATDGVAIHDKELIVTKENASLTLSYDSDFAPDEEFYFCFEELDYRQDAKGRGLFESLSGDSKTSSWITFSRGSNPPIQLHLLNNQNPYYCGHHNFLINLGNNSNQKSHITVTFSTAGQYTYSDISLIAQPTKHLSEYVQELPNTIPDTLQMGTNEIRGTITTNKDEYLFLSFLQSSGWKAYIDGQQVDLLTADDAFMAMRVTEGSHSFVLEYRTPLLYEGGLISAVSLLVVVCLSILQWRFNHSPEVARIRR